MKTAKEWRLPPSAWDALDNEDKAEMMAISAIEADMAAWEQDHPVHIQKVAGNNG